ncbi:MAG: hypothetical protein PVF77_16260 [Anaerolineae bacterium]|jgi:hypothetical protein
MHPQKRTMAWIVLLGGGAVVLSYVYILGIDPATQANLWGGVPAALLPAYVTSMALATGGFFAFTFFLLFRTDPDRVRIAGRLGYGLFYGLYVMILAPSALWLPLTSAMVQQPSSILWLGIRLVLGAVGVGSVALLLALLSLQPRQPARAYWLAVAGSVAFCFQTAVLDLFVWTALFPA